MMQPDPGLVAQLAECEDQLSALDAALALDPTNADLRGLREQLVGAIELLRQGVSESRTRAETQASPGASSRPQGCATSSAQPAKPSGGLDDSSNCPPVLAAPSAESGPRREPALPHLKDRSSTPSSAPASAPRFMEGDDCLLLRMPEARYHQAFVHSILPGGQCRLFWCHPRNTGERPCRDFRNGVCRHDRCRFSHGLVSSLSELRPVPVDCKSLRVKDLCLARYCFDGCWYDARVESIRSDAGAGGGGLQFEVEFVDFPGDLQVCKEKDIAPTVGQVNAALGPSQSKGSASSSGDDLVVSGSSEDESSEGEDTTDRPGFQGGLRKLGADYVLGDQIGEWEQHTTGFGSRMLHKLGYKYGEGLGKRRDGRALPVEVEVIPTNTALDFIRENKTTRRDRLQKEARARKKERKRAHKRALAAAEPERPDMFSFINTKLAGAGGSAGRGLDEPHTTSSYLDPGGSRAITAPASSSAQATAGSVNSKLMKVTEGIRAAEDNLRLIDERIRRNLESGDHVTAGAMQRKRLEMEHALETLQTTRQELNSEASAVSERKKFKGTRATKHLF